MKSRLFARLRHGIAALVIASGSWQQAAAQQRQEMVPAVLANAALSMFYGRMFDETPSIVSGRLPADFPAGIKPASPARVMGAVALGPFHVAAFTFPAAPNLVGRYESLLVRAGATRAPEAMRSGIRHGFAPSEPEKGGDSHAYCLSSTSVSVSRADTVTAPNTILVFWSTALAKAGMHSMCDPDYAEILKRDDNVNPSLAHLELPALVAPRGVRITSAGTSRGSDNLESTAWVDTSATADSLLAHFAREFAKAGWTVGTPVSNAETGSVSLSARKGSEVWRGGLYVVTGPDRRELVVRMLRARGS